MIFDEAQELDIDAQASFIPAISASLNPQVIYAGTPPDPNASGTVFRGIRDKALKGETTSTAWFEFSVKEIGDVHDKERWALANPALGTRILLSTVEGECEQMPPDAFARERLGWWTPVAQQRIEYAIPKDVWAKCRTDAQKPEGKTAYGVKFSPDGSEIVLAGAVIPQNGAAQIALIDRQNTGRGTQWLADWLNARYERAACVVIDGRNGADALIDKISPVWRMKGCVIRPSAREMISAVGCLTDALNERTVAWYRGQEDLENSAVTSVKRPIAGGWGFGGENPCPIEAASLALWGAKTARRDPNKQMRIG